MKPGKTTYIVSVVLLLVCCFNVQSQTTEAGTSPANAPLVPRYAQVMITAPPATLGVDTFYKKYADAFGIPIVSSGKTPDDALLIARDIVNYMLMKRMDVRNVLINHKARVLVMAQTEMETDLPERH